MANATHVTAGSQLPSPEQLVRIQRRTVLVLATATILGGLGVGAALSVGALLLAEVSGNDAISGLGSAMFGAGAAVAGIPLARLAAKRGRRIALVTGSLVAMVGAAVAIFGAEIGQWVILAIGIALVGVASAVQLLSRFAAADLAQPQHRARDLSLVVWSITIGAVVGPNLLQPGEVVGELLGITALAGVFVFPIIAQLLAAIVNWVGLRPDPLLTAQAIQADLESGRHEVDAEVAAVTESLLSESAAESESTDASESAAAPAPGAHIGREVVASPRGKLPPQVPVIVAVAMAQAVMVALMAMTPLHLMHHDGTAQLVGFTLSLHIAGMYALSPLFGYLAGRIGSLNVIWLGWAVLLLSVVLAYFAGSSHTLVQVALTLLGVGWGAVTVAGASLLTEISTVAERPKWQGRSDTIMNAAGAIAGALSGVVFALGDFSFLAVTGGMIVAVGALATLQLAMKRAAGERKVVVSK